MGQKLVPKIIIEGTRLTFKTDIAFALHDHPEITGTRKYRYHSPIISAEWCSFTNYPWGRGLINFAPDEFDKAMETYVTWVKLFELQRYYSWIIDRFHISTQMFQWQNHQRLIDFSWLEERLNRLNFRLVFLKRTTDSFQEAREKRLQVSGNPSQYDDLQIFMREQELLLSLLQKTQLPYLQVDISDNNIQKATEQIVSWMKNTNGLYLNE